MARKEDVTIPMSKCRSLQITSKLKPNEAKINPKVNPPTFHGKLRAMFKDNPDLVSKKLLAIWNTVRYLSS